MGRIDFIRYADQALGKGREYVPGKGMEKLATNLTEQYQPPRFEGIVVIVGAYGSGKTEVSINLSVELKKSGSHVWIADMDLVNPYFRTREARETLKQLGIHVVLPPEAYLNADLPVLSPLVAGVIRRSEGTVILDVGGNDVGATVIATLADAFQAALAKQQPLHVLLVINPYRPFTQTLSGCRKMLQSIEKASKQIITGIIGNPNLMEETTILDLYRGFDFVSRFSEDSGLPLQMITVPKPLLGHMERHRIPCPVLPIERRLAFPWKTGAALSWKAKLAGNRNKEEYQNEK